MTRTTLSVLRGLFVGALFLVSSLVPAQARPLWVVDFVYLAEGQDLSAHDKFAADGSIIAGRYGIKRLLTFDRVPGYAHPGQIAPDRIDLWSLPSQAALEGWTNDPDRVWYEDLAGHILASQSSRYLAREHAILAMRPGRLHLIDILQFAGDMDRPAFDGYVAALTGAVHGRGGGAAATFGDVRHLSGPFGAINQLIVYDIVDQAALDILLADPDYRKIEARRGALFDRSATTRQLYRVSGPFDP